MSKKLPHSGFRELTESEIKVLNLMEYDANSDIGYILEVIIQLLRSIILLT